MPGAGAPPPGAGGATGAGGAGGAGGANGVGWARGAAGAAGAAGAGGAAGAAPACPGGPLFTAAACPPAAPGADEAPALGAPVPLGRTASVPPVADPNGTGGRMPGEPGEAMEAPKRTPQSCSPPRAPRRAPPPARSRCQTLPCQQAPHPPPSAFALQAAPPQKACVCVCVAAPIAPISTGLTCLRASQPPLVKVYPPPAIE